MDAAAKAERKGGEGDNYMGRKLPTMQYGRLYLSRRMVNERQQGRSFPLEVLSTQEVSTAFCPLSKAGCVEGARERRETRGEG